MSRASVLRNQLSTLTAPHARPTRPSFSACLCRENERDPCCSKLRTSRFALIQTPSEVFATLLEKAHYLLLDSGRCIASWRSRARFTERVAKVAIPSIRNPELLARRPIRSWSLGHHQVMGPVKWSYFYLYVIRRTSLAPLLVGCRIEHSESAKPVQEIIYRCYAKALLCHAIS